MVCLQPADYRRIVEGVAKGDDQATTELVRVFHRGIRWYIGRQVPREAEDLTQDVLFETISSIKSGRLDDPERLAGYMRAIAHHKVCHAIKVEQSERKRLADGGLSRDLPSVDRTPEEKAQSDELRGIALQVLDEMSTKEQEILTRFYLYEQAAEQIQKEMGITATQYRLAKSRAKARFSTLLSRRTQLRPMPSVSEVPARTIRQASC